MSLEILLKRPTSLLYAGEGFSISPVMCRKLSSYKSERIVPALRYNSLKKFNEEVADLNQDHINNLLVRPSSFL